MILGKHLVSVLNVAINTLLNNTIHFISFSYRIDISLCTLPSICIVLARYTHSVPCQVYCYGKATQQHVSMTSLTTQKQALVAKTRRKATSSTQHFGWTAHYW